LFPPYHFKPYTIPAETCF